MESHFALNETGWNFISYCCCSSPFGCRGMVTGFRLNRIPAFLWKGTVPSPSEKGIEAECKFYFYFYFLLFSSFILCHFPEQSLNDTCISEVWNHLWSSWCSLLCLPLVLQIISIGASALGCFVQKWECTFSS